MNATVRPGYYNELINQWLDDTELMGKPRSVRPIRHVCDYHY